jgi:hypothetical protein
MDMTDRMQAVHRPLRLSLSALAAAGAALAATAAILTATTHGLLRDGIVYTLVAAGLSLVAIGIARSARWIVALTLVVCAGQIAAVIGLVLELVYGIAPFKAAQLRQLGVNPTVGVGINLLYSTAAFGLFCWAARRWLRRRHRRLL